MPPTVEPTTFVLFPLLAPELRLKIWQQAVPERTISVRYILESNTCLSPSKPPALLHTCHESREEALKTYTLSFGTHSSPARIYFNPYRDTLYLPRHRQMGYDETLRDFRAFLKVDEKEVLDDIQRIAIDHVDVAVKRPWESYNKASLMRGFPKLKEVFLVLSDGKGAPGLEDGERFTEPKENPEDLLRIWIDFRQSCIIEERVMEDISKAMEKEYVKWNLPTVKIKSRIRKVEADLDQRMDMVRI